MLRSLFKPSFVVVISLIGCGSAAAQPAGYPEQTPAETNPLPADPPVQLRTTETLGEAIPVSIPTPGYMQRPGATPEQLFPRYEVLKPIVAFWTQVFGEYSELQSVIHSMQYPHKVYEVLDYRDDALQMSKFELAKLRQKEETAAKNRVDKLLRSVHNKLKAQEPMDADELRVYEMFKDVPGEDRYLQQIGDSRSQRGLKERTELAFQVSEQYLPEMERIFASYGLPKQLTRLPLVESSFNVEAYSKVGAAGLWQFIPSSARIYMRLNDVVDDRRDPWTSTDAAARHLRDDYNVLGSWPLALTAYNHGRAGIANALRKVNGTALPDLIERHSGDRFGFASRNFYAEFLAASDVEREFRRKQALDKKKSIAFDVVETKHYVPYETLRRLCNASDEVFRQLNPAYRPEVIEGKLYVPPNHLIRVPAGSAGSFEVAYSKLDAKELFGKQRLYYQLHRVKKGETLGKLAKRYKVSQDAIRAANGLKKSAKLRSGQVLKIPPHTEKRPGPVTVAVGESQPAQTLEQKQAELAAAPMQKKTGAKKKPKSTYVVHKVRSGQTLYAIAKRYRVSVTALQEANNLGDNSHLSVGMKLKVPKRS